MALAPDGRVLVLDPLGPEVLVLDSTGAELTRFGGDKDKRYKRAEASRGEGRRGLGRIRADGGLEWSRPSGLSLRREDLESHPGRMEEAALPMGRWAPGLRPARTSGRVESVGGESPYRSQSSGSA